MPRTIETSVDIPAPVEKVWAALTDFPRLPEWSRFILAIDGEPRVGARLTVQLDGGGGPMTVRPQVTVSDEGQELRWLGTLGASFIFAGEHYFRLLSLENGSSRLIHGERFSGVLTPLLWSKLDRRTRKAFGDFNDALRERVQALS